VIHHPLKAPKYNFYNLTINCIKSVKRAGTKRFCPDWRCVLMCNMIIMSLLVILFLSGYYYVWPVFVQPLVKASQPIGKPHFKINCEF
jgi:hypothetical protein